MAPFSPMASFRHGAGPAQCSKRLHLGQCSSQVAPIEAETAAGTFGQSPVTLEARRSPACTQRGR